MISLKLIGVFLGLYISGVSATPTAETPNAPALLLPRVIPAGNECGKLGLLWSRRECMPEAGPQGWFDFCVTQRRAGNRAYQVNSGCPGNTYCGNINDGHDQSIKCVKQQLQGTSAARNTPKDPIIGSSGTFTGGSPNTQFGVTVRIEDAMKASVAALFLSKFLV
jgi:hypothetical protein